MTAYSRSERAALADLLLERGPDAPTLCAGWSTRHLAAHLVLRESRPLAAAGIRVGALAGRTQRAMTQLMNQPYDQLVATVRGGPPRWWPVTMLPPVEAAFNTFEFFVHHEDVRRVVDDWAPRLLPAPLEDQLWAMLRVMVRRTASRIGLPLALARPDGDTVRGGGGEPRVTVTGPPGELTLFVAGRQAHALVDLQGAPTDLDAVGRTTLGL